MTPSSCPSPNFDERPEGVPIDMIVLHYTGMQTGAAALERLCDPAAKVSAHYLIEEDGRAYALVDEENRAWHAGVASWRGHRDVNARSIGIELVNPGHEWGYRPFPYEQMATLVALLQSLCARHDIPARNIVGHSDVAPNRKQDPGELFDWHRLHQAGFGVWPDETALPCEQSNVSDHLMAIGYETENLSATLSAFQRRFRQSSITGEADEETRKLLAGVREVCQ